MFPRDNKTDWRVIERKRDLGKLQTRLLSATVARAVVRVKSTLSGAFGCQKKPQKKRAGIVRSVSQ